MTNFKFIPVLALCALLVTASAHAQEVIPPTTAAKPAAAKPLTAAASTRAPAVTMGADYGAWKMECPKGAPKSECSLVQRVMASGKDGKQVPGVLAVAGTSEEKTKDGKVIPVPHVRLISPLGAFLPKGIDYRLDEGKEGKTPFLFCVPSGCMAELSLNPETLGKLKGGKKLMISYSVLDTKAPRKVTVSMNGFAQGMAAMGR